MSKEPKKKDVRSLNEEDLFGDFKPIDDFIESDSFEVTDDNIKGPGKFEITADDKRKKPGHATPPKEQNVERLGEKDLFGNFKPIEEFIESDSYEVTVSGNEANTPRAVEKTRSNVSKLDEDDLFGDFKPLDEFIESDSFEVTDSNKGQTLKDLLQSSSNTPSPPSVTSPIPPISPPGVPSPPSISPITPPTGLASPPPSITPPTTNSGPTVVQPPPIGVQQTAQPETALPEPKDPTKLKLAEIAKRRKGQKRPLSGRKGDIDGLFDDLDPLELDDN